MATKEQRQAVRERRVGIFLRVLESWHCGVERDALIAEHGAKPADIEYLARKGIIEVAEAEYQPDFRRTLDARVFPSIAWKRMVGR